MNHYERLKVTQDAPIEVIRASYRALARMLHPDGQGGTGGRDDQAHHRMAALNGAYKVLSDPALRRDYDAALLASALEIDSPEGAQQDAHPEWSPSRVEVDWPLPRSPEPDGRLVRRRTMGVAVLGLVALLGAGAWLTWQVTTRQQVERALSDQYAASAAGATVMASAPLAPLTPFARVHPLASEPAASTSTSPTTPTVEELSRMSDEQLLEVLPTLGEPQAPRPATFANPRLKPRVLNHPLDGQPLSLRIEQHLTDPLSSAVLPPLPDRLAAR